MAEKVKDSVEEKDNNPFVETVRKVLLASIGAVALAQEEIDEFVNRLIEKGELAEKDGKRLAKEVFEKRKKHTQKAEKELNKQVEDVMGRINIPTKDDIETLSKKIAELSKKVDQLKKE